MDIDDRIEEFVNHLHIGKRDFEIAVGIASGTLSKKTKNGVRSDTLRRIKEKYPQLNLNWIVAGEGMMLNGHIEVPPVVTDGIKERLFAFLEHEGIGQTEFEKKCGMGQGFASRITDNVREDSLKKISRAFPHLRMYWLRTGDGDMLLTEDEIARNSQPAVETATPENVVYVPLVSQYAYGSYVAGYSSMEYLSRLAVRPFVVDNESKHSNYMAFEVRNDSMDDGLRHAYAQGDIILCREVDRAYYMERLLDYDRSDFVIVHNDGILVKRIIAHDVMNHKITVHSFNPIFDDLVIDLADVRQIFSVILKQQQCRR